MPYSDIDFVMKKLDAKGGALKMLSWYVPLGFQIQGVCSIFYSLRSLEFVFTKMLSSISDM